MLNESHGIDFSHRRRPPIVVGLVPLIDVAMFLLIFFMVAGTIEKLELLTIDPPYAESGKLVDEGSITILLGSRDEIVIGDEMSDLTSLEGVMRGQLEGNSEKVITLKADSSIPAPRLIQVMDRIKAAGGKHLSIITQSAPAVTDGSAQ